MNYVQKGVLPFFLVVLMGAGCLAPAEQPDLSSLIPEVEEPMYTFPGKLEDTRIANKQARIVTDRGEIVIRLFNETAPLTTSNFVSLAEQDFYDGLVFHRREEGFVIQGGDPNGNGTGGPGYQFEDELSDELTYTRGIVAMANRGPNTNGSQFFIMLADTPLPKQYTIFGEVTLGLDVVDRIQIGDVMTDVIIEDIPVAEGEGDAAGIVEEGSDAAQDAGAAE